MRRLLRFLLCKAFHTGTYEEWEHLHPDDLLPMLTGATRSRVVVRVCSTCGRNLL